MLFRMMVTHGVPPEGLLFPTFVPIPKNTRYNKYDSNNYRQSLPGKIVYIIYKISSKLVRKLMFYNLGLRKIPQL